MNDLDLTVRLKADGSGLRGELRLSKAEIEKLGKDLDQAGDEAKQSADKLDKYGKEAKEAAGASRRLKKETVAVRDVMGSLGGILGGLTLTALVKDVIDTNREFESLNASLITVTGSSELAAAAFTGIKALASETPFSVKELTESFIKLQALGLEPSERALVSYGNTASAMGKSLNQMIEAVADAATGEFERLKEFGIKASSQGDKVTFTFRGVSTTVAKEAGAIEGYLMRLGENQFGDAMARQAATMNGALSNLGDAWDALMDRLLDEQTAGGLTNVVRGFAEILNWIATDGISYFQGSVVTAIGAIQKSWDWLKTTTVIVWESIHLAAVKAVEAVRNKLGDLYLSMSKAASALGMDDLSNSLFSAAAKMQSFGNIAGQIEGRIKTLRAEHERYVKTVDDNVDEYKKWNWEAAHQKNSLDDVVKALKKDTAASAENAKAKATINKAQESLRKSYAGIIKSLSMEYLRLTEGERAAYEYSLTLQGFNEAQIQAALSVWDMNKALSEQKAEMETASKANAETANEFQKVWENAVSSVDNIFRDLWRGAFDSAKDFGQSLKEWFANLLAELAHQALTRPIVLSLGAAFSGSPGSAMAGQGGFGGGGFDLSQIGSFFGGDSIAMTLNRGVGFFNGGSGVGAGFVGPPSPGVTPMFGGTNLGYGLAGIGGAFIGNWVGEGEYAGMAGGIGGSIGYGLAAGSAASGGMMAGLGALAGPVGMLVGALLGGALTRIFDDQESPSKFYLRPGLEPDYDNTKRPWEETSFGAWQYGKHGELIATSVATPFGTIGAAGSGFGKDEQLSDDVRAQYVKDMTDLFIGLGEIDKAIISVFDLSDDVVADITQAVSDMESQVATREMPDIESFIKDRYAIIFGAASADAAAIYDAMASVSSGADITEIVGQVTAFFSTFEAYKNVFADYDEMVRQAGLTQTEAMAEFTAGLYEQIAAYDGSIEANQAITAGMAQRYQMELQMLAQIDAAQKSVSATLGKSIEAIRMSQMTDEQRYEYLTGQAEALAASLNNMTDPAQITETVNEINRLTMAAWNSLSEEQQAQVAGGFEGFLASVDERANAQLEKAREDLQNEHDALVSAYTDMANAARALADAVANDQPDNTDTADQPAEPNPLDKLFGMSEQSASKIDAVISRSMEDAAQRFALAAGAQDKAATEVSGAAARFSGAAEALARAVAAIPDAITVQNHLTVEMDEVGA